MRVDHTDGILVIFATFLGLTKMLVVSSKVKGYQSLGYSTDSYWLYLNYEIPWGQFWKVLINNLKPFSVKNWTNIYFFNKTCIFYWVWDFVIKANSTLFVRRKKIFHKNLTLSVQENTEVLYWKNKQTNKQF